MAETTRTTTVETTRTTTAETTRMTTAETTRTTMARGKDNETTRDKGTTGRRRQDNDHDHDHDHDDDNQHNSTPTMAVSSCSQGGLRGLNDRAGGRTQRGDEDGDRNHHNHNHHYNSTPNHGCEQLLAGWIVGAKQQGRMATREWGRHQRGDGDDDDH